jgi:choline dehydrogenase-like flavoprotein
VIVSSGAIGSPKLLMQSGIGPADHLTAVGVPVLHGLPGVGGNMQDHLDLFVICECTGDHTYDNVAKLHRTLWAGIEYMLFRTGPVASSLFETGGFWYADQDVRSPDIQFHLGLGSGIEAGVARLKRRRHSQFRLSSSALARHGPPLLGRSGGAAADRSELLERSARSEDVARRAEDRARDHAAAGA